MTWGFKRAIGCVAGITFGLYPIGAAIVSFWKALVEIGCQMETRHVVIGFNR
jgi:hypothetical protein